MKELLYNTEKREKGFTLLEIIMALGISMLIIIAIYSSVNMAQKSSTSVTRRVFTQQDARAILDIMAMEIRMASFNPHPPTTGSTWSTIPNGTNLSLANAPITGNKGIQIATANQIHISMDLNSSGIIGDASNEYILYTYSAANNAIYRNVSDGGNNAILGGSDDSDTTVINDASTPMFQYFDRDGNATTSIPDIRRIRITIIAQTKGMNLLSGKVKVIPYSTDVLVKNHVLSP